jgi:hypothetical protein
MLQAWLEHGAFLLPPCRAFMTRWAVRQDKFEVFSGILSESSRRALDALPQGVHQSVIVLGLLLPG